MGDLSENPVQFIFSVINGTARITSGSSVSRDLTTSEADYSDKLEITVTGSVGDVVEIVINGHGTAGGTQDEQKCTVDIE